MNGKRVSTGIYKLKYELPFGYSTIYHQWNITNDNIEDSRRQKNRNNLCIKEQQMTHHNPISLSVEDLNNVDLSAEDLNNIDLSAEDAHKITLSVIDWFHTYEIHNK